MSWQTVILLIALGLSAIGYLVLGLLLWKEQKNCHAAEREIAIWKGRALTLGDAIRRMQTEEDTHGLTDKDALDRLAASLGNWNPLDSDTPDK